MKIAVVGSYGVGLSMRVSVVPEAGETVGGGVFSVGHGGKGSNQAVAAARLGATVDFFSAVGADSYGDRAKELWASEGINAREVRTVEAQTMAGFILVEPSGENRIIIAPGALDTLTPTDVESFRPALAQADIAVVSLEIPHEVAFAALRIAHEEGTRTILNPAPASALPGDTWSQVNIITPNQTELRTLLGISDSDDTPFTDLAVQLQRLTNSDIVVTLGADGALVVTSTEITPIAPVTPSAVVDTTGAGDAFTAALAVGLAEKMTVVNAAIFAAKVGAFTVATAEVIPALPWRHSIDSLHP